MEVASPGQLAGRTVSASREQILADSAGHPGPVFRVGLSGQGTDAYGTNATCYVFGLVSVVLRGGVAWSKTKQPHLTPFRGSVPWRDLFPVSLWRTHRLLSGLVLVETMLL